uniref:Uncharacterized protein n=1 Tax=Octopus bimaculoides TaxID=37653 RepID=A0A0L8H7H3_OCTBM
MLGSLCLHVSCAVNIIKKVAFMFKQKKSSRLPDVLQLVQGKQRRKIVRPDFTI